MPHIKSAQSGGDDSLTEDHFYDQVKLFKYAYACCARICDVRETCVCDFLGARWPHITSAQCA